MSSIARKLGIGAIVGVGLIAFIASLVIAPFVFWLAWNAMGLGPAMGLPKLGLWATVLAALFLVVGWFGKALITAVVFMVDPEWLHQSAQVSWPEPSFKHWVAVLLLVMLAGRPHAAAQNKKRGGAAAKKGERSAADA